MTGVPKTTVGALKKLVHSKDQAVLDQMLDKTSNAGRNTVLTKDEEKMIVSRLKDAACRGFAIGVDSVKDMMSRIAGDGRIGWRNGVPSDDAVRAFRSRNRDITYRKIESKEQAKLRSENFPHDNRFFEILKTLAPKHDGLLRNPHRIINIVKTNVDATYGKRRKAFTAADSHHGGFVGETTCYGNSQHITALVVATASGLIAPPFFIIEVKRMNERWWSLITGSFGEEVSGICAKYTKPNWLPSGTVIKCSTNGSIEKPILVAAVKHMNNFVRRFVSSETYLLCLDGHSSRKGVEWVEECICSGCEAVIQPANTSHFLQPCDQTINQQFKQGMRELRDAFRRLGTIDTRQVNFNLACAIHAYETITSAHVTNAFKVTGAFPFQANFAERFKRSEDGCKDKAGRKEKN